MKKFEDWTGKRISVQGEYQIETVRNLCRWEDGTIEHNPIEISCRCGHVEVLTDEGVKFLNDWSFPGLNSDTGPLSREQWIQKTQGRLCGECAEKRVPEAEEITSVLGPYAPHD